MARALNESLKTKGPENTMMLLAEAAKVPYLYTTDDSWADRANVIPTYFKSDSEHYLGDLERMPKLICAHSYWWIKHGMCCLIHVRKPEMRRINMG